MNQRYNTRSAKLTNSQVLEIYRLYHEERWSQPRLAREFNMSGVQIGRIVRGESHRTLLYNTDVIEDVIDPNVPPPSQEDMDRLKEALARSSEPTRDVAPTPEEHAANIARLAAIARERNSQTQTEEETRTDDVQDSTQHSDSQS